MSSFGELFLTMMRSSNTQIWLVSLSLANIFFAVIFRVFNILPKTLKNGSRGSDVIAFELVAGFCVTYLSLAGVIGYFGLFGVKTFPDGITADQSMYVRSEYIEKYMIIPMFAYQLWNIIAIFFVSDLFGYVMLGHHSFALVLSIFLTLPYSQWYAPFFLGIIELTNIPLTFVDIFRMFPEFEENSVGRALNSISKFLFTFSFFLIRLIIWPYQIYLLLKSLFNDIRYPTVLGVGLAMVLALTGLQYYWGYRIIRFLTRGEKQSKKSE